MNAEQRARIDRRGPDECHEWTGARNGDGYGVVRVDGTLQLVHRLVLAEKLGRPLAEGEQARHRCDNPPCANGRHLRPGTHAQNQADMVERGRASRGEDRPMAKLTEAAVLAIRADGRPSRVVAGEYGVSPGTIRLVRARKRWGWVAA